MKKNRTMKIATLMLALTLITCCFVGSTFAKYTSEATGTATATVAKWDVTVADVTLGTAEQNFTFDLFKTITDTKEGTPKADGQSVADNVIAPGTSGTFTIELTNNSEVDAQFDIVFSINGAAVPFTWTVKCGEQQNNTLTGFNAVAFDMEETVEVVVSWEWPFDANDDTALGVATSKTVTVTADVTVTQVD